MWIGDVFARERAEQIPLLDMPTLFSPPPEMVQLERRSNHIVLGAKGSGKSTLLRALTFPVWLRRSATDVVHPAEAFLPGLGVPQPAPPTRPPEFMGVYVPMRYEDASTLRTAFDEAQNEKLFEHFFVSNVLYNLALQWGENSTLTAALMDVASDYVGAESRRKGTLGALALAFQHDCVECLDAARNSPAALPDELPLRSRSTFGLNVVYQLSAQLSAALAGTNLHGRDRLGLLIDSFDYYGSLSALLLPLLESDAPYPLCVKIAARTLNVPELCLSSRSRSLEVERDFGIVALDRLPDDEEHHRLMREAIVRRIRTVGGETFTRVDDHKLMDLVFNGSEEDNNDLASFESMCRLSSGNILALILLLEEAATHQRHEGDGAEPKETEPVSRASRLAVINNESRRFWDLEIGVRVPTQSVEAKALCEKLLDLDERLADGRATGSPVYEIGSIPEEDRAIFGNLFAQRILVLRNSELHRSLQAGFGYSGAVEFELNRLMLPTRNRLPQVGEVRTVDWKEERDSWRKAVQLSKPHLSPRSTLPQTTLFPADFRVFISLPFDRKKRQRTVILRKAINRLYLAQTGRPGAPGVSYVDIDYIPHVGSFRSDIPRYITDATYFVADISDAALGPRASPGVFYELGLAVALLKPFALFFNERGAQPTAKKFSLDLLPEILRAQTVMVVREDSRNFSEEFRKVHERLIGYNGRFDRPFGLPASSEEMDASAPERYAYVSFQPRHASAEEWCVEQIKRLFPGLAVERAKEWQQGDGTALYRKVVGAVFSIVDCSDGANSSCLELGLAAAHDWKRTLLLFAAGQSAAVNPVSMYPGSRFAWTDLGSDDTRVLRELLLEMSRAKDLGLRRP